MKHFVHRSTLDECQQHRTAKKVTTMQISKNHTCQSQENRSGAYATKEDFCRIFSEEMNSLYSLSLLLTADHKNAEQCFVTGIEECSAGRPIFKQWAHSWTRRIIIQAAIRMISPRGDPTRESAAVAVTGVVAEHSENDVFLLAITQLPSFERFVFVMSALERYSDQDCCVLLGCSCRELIDARTHALELLLTFHSRSLRCSEPNQFTRAVAELQKSIIASDESL
jgi:DNA-directed RNA polymerase specialized sigma24 family protein